MGSSPHNAIDVGSLSAMHPIVLLTAGRLGWTAGSGLHSRSEILACPGRGKAAKRRSPLQRIEGVPKPLDSRTLPIRSSASARHAEAGRLRKLSTNGRSFEYVGPTHYLRAESRRQLIQPAQKGLLSTTENWLARPPIGVDFHERRRPGICARDSVSVMRDMATT